MPIRIDAGVSVIGDPMILAPQIWLRADRGITVATGVSSWADQSGNGNHFVQATSVRQPAFVSSLAGRPAVWWGAPTSTANTKGLYSETANQSITGDLEWYAIAYVSSADWAAFIARPGSFPYSALLDLSDNSAFSKNYIIYSEFNPSDTRFYVGGTASTMAGAITQSVPVLMGLRRTGSAPTGIRDNTTLALSNNANAPVNQRMTIGNIYYNYSQPHLGSVFEVIAFNRYLSTPERAILYRYLSARYAQGWSP